MPSDGVSLGNSTQGAAKGGHPVRHPLEHPSVRSGGWTPIVKRPGKRRRSHGAWRDLNRAKGLRPTSSSGANLDFGTQLAISGASLSSLIQVRSQAILPTDIGKHILAALKATGTGLPRVWLTPNLQGFVSAGRIRAYRRRLDRSPTQMGLRCSMALSARRSDDR